MTYRRRFTILGCASSPGVPRINGDWGACDPNNPRNRLEGLYRYGFSTLPRPAQFVRIEGADHQVMIDQPARFQAAVEQFLG